MVYLLDANVLITASNVHYPMDVFPVFWDWLEHQVVQGVIRMPREIFDEIKDGSSDVEHDALYAWLQREPVKKGIVLDEEVDVELLQQVLADAYLPANDVQLIAIGQDPFLVAYGKATPDARCVVTYEVSQPHMAPHNRKVPDACASAGVSCCHPLKMLRELGFTTGWRAA